MLSEWEGVVDCTDHGAVRAGAVVGGSAVGTVSGGVTESGAGSAVEAGGSTVGGVGVVRILGVSVGAGHTPEVGPGGSSARPVGILGITVVASEPAHMRTSVCTSHAGVALVTGFILPPSAPALSLRQSQHRSGP